MTSRTALGVLTACTAALLVAAPAVAKTIEQEKPYAITGTTGAELYASIGQNGPEVGRDGRRTIAYTFFTLTWSRNYVRQDGGCVLKSATPKLTITYTLPKPKNPLSPEVQKRWDVFLEGIRSHEKVHGEDIKAMLTRIEQTTIGLFVPNDPDCKKIRQEILKPLSEASLAQRQHRRDFDRIEMGADGTIHRLILSLVNGP